MTVLLLLTAACDLAAPSSLPPGTPNGASPANVPATSAPEGGTPGKAHRRAGAASDEPPGRHAVELVLERGRLADAWTSEPAVGDVLLDPPAIGAAPDPSGARRWRATLPAGPGIARVARAGCSAVEVPFTVVGAVPIVALPYPACDALDAPLIPGSRVRLDRTELPWSRIEALHQLELFMDLPSPAPGEEDGPARWITHAEAGALCAWHGGRLPTSAEWTAARADSRGTAIADATRGVLGSGAVGPTARALAHLPERIGAGGHLDLDGNLEEWLADGTVAGGSWSALPDELGVTRRVPLTARTDTVGLRCAYDSVANP